MKDILTLQRVRDSVVSCVYHIKWFGKASAFLITLVAWYYPVVASKTNPETPLTIIILDGAIRGKITDTKGEVLPGVTVLISGTSKGATSDETGSFILPDVAPGSYRLRISSIGFQTVTKDVNLKNGDGIQLNIVMQEENATLNEVVVTGYSKQSRRDVTGAVSTISSDVIAKTPVTDISSVLQGRVAGLTVDGQGGPGNQQVVRVRGFGTLGDNDPLYVIDGVQTKGGLNLINQNDIETITVLKDAASAALYGARGGNGVIVITTKRGKNGAPRLEYDTYVGMETPRKLPSMISPQNYADALWKSYSNSTPAQNPTSSLYGKGTSPVLPDFIVERSAGPVNLGVATGDPAADASLYNLQNYRILKANKEGTNWFKEIFKPALTQSHQLTLSGATEKSNYAVSFNYLNNKGTMLNTYFNRYSIRTNTEFRIKPWLRVGENLQFSYSNGNSVNGHSDQNVVANLYGTSPLLPVYDIAGNYAGTNMAPELGGSNPVFSRAASLNNKGYSARLLGSAYGEVEPVPGLILQSKITIDYLPYQYRSFSEIYPQEPYSSPVTNFSESAGYSMEWRSTNKISYDFVIKNLHKISAFIGYEASEYNARSLGGSNDSLFFNQPGFQVLGTGRIRNMLLSGSVGKTRYISQFGNINYAYGDRYLASFTIRRDGSSRFGPLSRFGVFPSATVGWRVSKESFMSGVTWVNDLKLRAAVGRSGNDAIPQGVTVNQYYTNPSYTYYDLGGTNNSAMAGFALTQIGNAALHWEINKTTNLGFDAVLLNNRVTTSFSWFRRVTDGLLYQPPVTSLQGDAGAPYQNVMNFTNKGIELELGYNGPATDKIQYNMNFNLATYRNNVTYIDGDPNTFILGGLYARQTNLSRSEVGSPISSFYGYVHEGTFQNAEEVKAHAKQAGITEQNGVGHFKFADLNNDGVVDEKDRTYIGSPHPKFSYGYNLNLTYKRLDLGIFLQGVYGNKIFNYWRTASVWPGKWGKGALDTWSTENTGAKLPIYTRTLVPDDRPSTFFIEDGSYLRLKNIQLGYTLPAIKGITKLRVYAQVYNILTFTKYSGMDPEVSTGSAGNIGIDFGGYYPVSKKFLFGINLTL
jgi:TonB-dependent starch-binding outer membrane protein SusC